MIKELTKEQEALIPIIRDKWIKIGLSTDTNKPLAEEGIKEAYEAAGLPPPKEIIWVQSPLAIKKLNQPIIYGQHDAAELSNYDFWIQCGVTGCKKMQGMIKIAQAACWWVPFEDKVYISEKAIITKVDENNKLHSTDGPAILYKDGFGLFFIHGIQQEK